MSQVESPKFKFRFPFWHEPIQLNDKKQPGEVVYTTLQLTRLRRTAVNFQRFVVISVIGMFLSGIVFAIGSWVTDSRREYDRCLSSNRSRAEIKDAFKGLYDGFVFASPPDRKQAAIDFRDEQLAGLEKALPQRNC